MDHRADNICPPQLSSVAPGFTTTTKIVTAAMSWMRIIVTRVRALASVGTAAGSFSSAMALRCLRIQMTPKCSTTPTRTKTLPAKCPRRLHRATKKIQRAPAHRPSTRRAQSQNQSRQRSKQRSLGNQPIRPPKRLRRIRWSSRIRYHRLERRDFQSFQTKVFTMNFSFVHSIEPVGEWSGAGFMDVAQGLGILREGKIRHDVFCFHSVVLLWPICRLVYRCAYTGSAESQRKSAFACQRGLRRKIHTKRYLFMFSILSQCHSTKIRAGGLRKSLMV